MEITYEEENYPNNPSVNKNQTGWYAFGSIVGKNTDPKLAMAEALDSLIGKLKFCYFFFFFNLAYLKFLLYS